MLVHADEVFVAQVSCSERITFFVETLLASHLIETSERRRRDRPRPSELDRYETSTARQAAATDKRGWQVGTTVTTEPPSPGTLNSLSKSTHTQIGSLHSFPPRCFAPPTALYLQCPPLLTPHTMHTARREGRRPAQQPVAGHPLRQRCSAGPHDGSARAYRLMPALR